MQSNIYTCTVPFFFFPSHKWYEHFSYILSYVILYGDKTLTLVQRSNNSGNK